MTNETGTLAELGVQPGDVVEGEMLGTFEKYNRTVASIDADKVRYTNGGWDWINKLTFTLISRANQPDAAPKTFGEMTDAEKGELYVAKHYYGKQIQRLFYGNTPAEYWRDTDFDDPQDEQVYRIKPEPEKGTVVLNGSVAEDGEAIFVTAPHEGRHTITIPTNDGKPIPGTYRSEAGDELIVGEV